MRKLLLIVTALVLLALVLGVSYIKALRADSSQDQLYSKANEEFDQRIEDSLQRHRQIMDSLAQASVQQQLDFLTVVNRAALHHRADIDSLAAELSRRDSVIDSISRRLADVGDGTRSESSAQEELTKEEKRRQREKAIIEHYKKKYASLPGDLSAYEKKVALGEIRSETANKYGLSMSELESLRKKYKLTY